MEQLNEHVASSASGKRASPPRRTLRAAGWAGIAFSILSLVVLPLVASPASPELPVLGAPASAFAAWFTVHRTGFLLGNYLGIAAFVPGFVQLAVLAARVRSREDDAAWLGSFVLASGTFTYAVFACSLVAFQAMPFLVDPAASQATLAIGTLANVWFALDGLAALPFLVAVAWATRATGALPRWVGPCTSGTAAFAALMSVGALVDHPAWLAAGGAATLAGFVVFFVWTFALGVVFLRLEP